MIHTYRVLHPFCGIGGAAIGTERARERCSSCGRSDFVDAVDNLGQSYRGCAHCRIIMFEEILRRSSLGQGLARIRDEGIEAELAELEQEMGTRRKR